MNKISVASLFLGASFFCFYSCSNVGDKSENTVSKVKDSTTVLSDTLGKIELYDAQATAIIDSNAVIEIIGKGFNWAEGPVWIADKKMLIFSDVPENKIFEWQEGKVPKVYLTPSGYTDTAKRNGENGSNGLAVDNNRRLLLCQSGNRQVGRMNAPIDSPRADYTILAPNYHGKKFNSPNDIIADSKNNVYFTDPIYGLPLGEKDASRELNFEGVFKIEPSGKISLLIDSIHNPNGIALSADEKTLYVASSNDQHPGWYAYALDATGNVRSGGLLLDGTIMKEKAKVKQGADGFKIDKSGNIFSAGPDGINIISPAGKLLGLIKVYNRRTSNCAFNETKDILFVTADDLVLKIKLHS